MEETQRQNLVMAFNNVLRTSTLVGVVDLQRAALAFSSLLEHVPDGAPVPLGPLYDFFLEQKAPETQVRDVIVFLKSREGRFAVTLELPPQLQNLSPEDQAKIVAGFTQRGASTGTFAGKSIKSGPAGPTSPTPAGGTPAVRPGKAENPTAKSSGSTTKKLSIALAVLAVLLVINLVVDGLTKPPPPAPLVLADPAGLPCVDPIGGEGTVVCKLPKAFLDAHPRESLEARGAITKAAAKARGFNQVMVFGLEDGRMKWVF